MTIMQTSHGNLIAWSEFPSSEQLSFGLFTLSDYTLLLIVLVFGLLLGITQISKKYKTNIYLLIIVSLASFLIIKKQQEVNLESAEDKFILDIILCLIVLLIGYFLLLQEEQKTETLRFEYPVLILIAIFGILITLENTEGLIIFLGLEVQAFTFYTLVSMKEKEIFSAEGALKYFLIGAIASGLFILGLGFLYGFLGKTNFQEIAEILPNNDLLIIRLGGLLVIISLLFKIGAAPFHLWVADAYQGAPFYVLLFLITFPKIVLYYLIFTLNTILEQNMVIILALMTSSIVGSIQATVQSKIKRFIAYTIIFNNAFFLAITVLAGKSAFLCLIQSLLLYLIIGLTTALCFFVLMNSETQQRLLSLRDLISIKKSNIFVALVIMLGFFSAAGIPPFLGFFQKYLVLLALTEKLQIFLLVFLIISAILPAFYYIRMSKILYFLTDSKFILLKDINKMQATLLTCLFVLTLGIFY